MEPLIAYLMDQKKMTRKRSVIIVMGTAFVWGIPCALSFSFFKEIQVWNLSIFSCFEFLTQDILIPIGGLCVLLLVGWKWKIKKALQELKVGTESIFLRFPILDLYFKYAIKYIAPIWVIIIFLDALGVL